MDEGAQRDLSVRRILRILLITAIFLLAEIVFTRANAFIESKPGHCTPGDASNGGFVIFGGRSPV
jgi:hypothetical protein